MLLELVLVLDELVYDGLHLLELIVDVRVPLGVCLDRLADLEADVARGGGRQQLVVVHEVLDVADELVRLVLAFDLIQNKRRRYEQND